MITPHLHFIQMVILTSQFYESYSACNTGWFGAGCQYKCRCMRNLCSYNGDCLIKVPCVSGWFGPKCQYVDLLQVFNNTAPSWISDENDTTCNPNLNETSLHFKFTQQFHFSWIRVIVFNESDLTFFQLHFDHGMKFCSQRQNFVVNTLTVDVVCVKSSPVIRIELDGTIVGHLCSLYISGGKLISNVAFPGRNLALRQLTNQSSYKFGSNSEAVVDSVAYTGSTSIPHCSQTDVGDTNSTWYLYYRFPITLYRAVVVFNRNEQVEHLRQFEFRTYDVDDKLIENYTAHGEIRSVYQVPLSMVWKNTSWLSVNLNSQLTLCEVETYGDLYCPNGRWGIYCTSHCLCHINTTCFGVTGNCAINCSAGFGAWSCPETCPRLCDNRTCNKTTGACFGCVIGYYGKTCSIKCPEVCENKLCNFTSGHCISCHSGLYGPYCSSDCPKSCKNNLCHPVGGHCLECPDEFYGYNCSTPCPATCRSQLCQPDNGECLLCQGNFYGSNCTIQCPYNCKDRTCYAQSGNCVFCKPTFYGKKCLEQCTACKNGLCDQEDGTCFFCEDGFYGYNCSTACPKGCSRQMCLINNGSCMSCNVGLYGLNCTLVCDCWYSLCEQTSGICLQVESSNFTVSDLLPFFLALCVVILVAALLMKKSHKYETEATDMTEMLSEDESYLVE